MCTETVLAYEVADPKKPVFTKALNGNHFLLYRKYKYLKKQTTKYNNRWHCTTQGCSASVFTAIDSDTILREDFLHNHPANPNHILATGVKRKRGRKPKKRNPSFTEVEEAHHSLNPVDKINKYRQAKSTTSKDQERCLPNLEPIGIEIQAHVDKNQSCTCHASVDVDTIISKLKKLGTRLLGNQKRLDSTNEQHSLMPVELQNSGRPIKQMAQANQYIGKYQKKASEYDSILKNILYRPSQTLIENPDLIKTPRANLMEPAEETDHQFRNPIDMINYRPYQPDKANEKIVYEGKLAPHTHLNIINTNIPDPVTQIQLEMNYQPRNKTEVRSNRPYQLEFPLDYLQQRVKKENPSLNSGRAVNYQPYQSETPLDISSQPKVGDHQLRSPKDLMSYQTDTPTPTLGDNESQFRNPLEMKKKYREGYPQPQIKPRTQFDYNTLTYSPYAQSLEIDKSQSSFDSVNNNREDTPQLEIDYQHDQFDSMNRTHHADIPYFSTSYPSYTAADFVNAPLNLAKTNELPIVDVRPRMPYDLISINDRPDVKFTSSEHRVQTRYFPRARTLSDSNTIVGSSYRRIENDGLPSSLAISHHARLANIDLPPTLQGIMSNQSRVDNNNQPTPQVLSPSENTQVQLEITQVPYPQINIQIVESDKTETTGTQEQKPPYFFYREHTE